MNCKFKFSLFIFFLILAGSVTVAYAEEKGLEDFYVAEKAFNEKFYSAAYDLFSKFLSAYPQSAKAGQARLFIAKSLFHENKFAKAEELLTSLVNESSDYDVLSEGLYWLGEINRKAKKYSKAAEFFIKVKDEYPKSSVFGWALYSLGLVYIDSGEAGKAEKIFQSIIGGDFEDSLKENSFYALANFFYSNKQYDKLKDVTEKWAKSFPNTLKKDYVNFFMGEFFYSSKEYSSALDYYLKALKYLQDYKLKNSIFQGLGWSSLEKKDYSDAEKYFFQIGIPDSKLYSLGSLYLRQKKYNSAVSSFGNMIRLYPKSKYLYKAYIGKGDSLYELGRINDAISAYLKVAFGKDNLSDKAVLDDAFYGLGWSYLKLEDYKKAISFFKQLTRSSEEEIIKISSGVNIGDVYQESGDLDKALSVYENVLKEFPNNLYSDYIQLQIGLCLLKKDDFEGSLMAFNTLMSNFPDSKFIQETSYYQALSYSLLGHLDKSKGILEGFIKKFPDSRYLKDVYLLLMQIYAGQKDNDKLVKIINRAEKLKMAGTGFIEKISLKKGLIYFDMDKLDTAASAFREFIKRFSDSKYASEAVFYLALINQEKGDYGRAEDYYRKIITDYSSSSYISNARMNLAEILWQKGDSQGAEEVIKKNLSGKLSPDDIIQTNFLLADILEQKQDYSRALDICDSLIKKFPDKQGIIFFKKAGIYKDEGDYSQALINYGLAEKEGYSSPEMFFSEGYSLERTGKLNAAVEKFFKLVYLYPKDKDTAVKAYLRIAKLYERMGEFESAKKAYSKVIDLNVKESKFAREQIDRLANGK